MKIDFNKYIKIILIVTASLTLIIILIALIISFAGRSAAKDAITESLPELNFQIPDKYKTLWENQWVPSIDQGPINWNWEKIQEFWVDTEKIGVTILEEQNDELIESSFFDFQ